MDLNFADPPLPSGMVLYEPTIGAGEAEHALQDVATYVRTTDAFTAALGAERTKRIVEGIEDPQVAEVYAESVPFVARFLTVELDTQTNSVQGFGRPTPRHAPKRFGDGYKRSLKTPEARERIGVALERLIFRGFASGAGLNAMQDEPARIVELPTDEWWSLFLYSLSRLWNDTIDPKTELGELVIEMSRPTLQDYRNVARDLKLGRGPFKEDRALACALDFLALGWILFSTRTDSG